MNIDDDMAVLLDTLLTDSNDSKQEGPGHSTSSIDVPPLPEAPSNLAMSPPKKPANFVPQQPLSADKDDDKFIDIIEHYFQDLNDESGSSSSSTGIADSTLLSPVFAPKSSNNMATTMIQESINVDANDEGKKIIELIEQPCREFISDPIIDRSNQSPLNES